jgi:transcription-repair coupling factor (superfamily II helicase)
MAAHASLLEILAKAPPFQDALHKRIARGRRQTDQNKDCVEFPHVVAEAHPVLAALLSSTHTGRTWIVCPNPAAQERLFVTLQLWQSHAVFFPEAPIATIEGTLPDPELLAERLALLSQLHTKPSSPECIIITRNSLTSCIPNPKELRRNALVFRKGQVLERDVVLARLEDEGYEVVPRVAERGHVAVRGGILDIFGFQHLRPVRLEFFGDEVESIRAFELDSQGSVETLEECTLVGIEATESDLVPFLTLIGAKDWVVCSDALEKEDDPVLGELPVAANLFYICTANPKLSSENPDNQPITEDHSTACYPTNLGPFDVGDFVVDERKREIFFHQLTQWIAERWRVFLFCRNEGDIERLQEMIPGGISDALVWVQGEILGGFVCPSAGLAVLCDADLLGRSLRGRMRRRPVSEVLTRGMLDFTELTEGELVVHLEHGIGRFEGLRELPREGSLEQVLVLKFANDARLYVPLEQSGMVSRYVGIGRKNPPLSELGDGKWAKARKNAEAAVFQYAGRLLALQAERESNRGFAFPPDSRWVEEFEDAFPYKETPDQLTAVAAAKADMESSRPMDRLICGDVGFGKTEVAIRAAFKAVMGGKQVAMLVPTTVLAEQHYRNFRERMSAFPVRIEMLSRFRTQAQQRETLRGLKDGSVDLVIGTHRILSTKLEFKDLGLVVIDEEQRFGVLHKERLKERFRLVDQLTLSATPIPRTLYLSLMGAKDMSTLETPPANRIPVETVVCAYDERIIRDAIQREMARGGQVYFLHNRIESIYRIRERLQTLLPKARIVVGHGQMDEDELEDVMHQFVSGEADVLISTTIIESGLDIPNANTILIDRADRFGLADLYQLRGRVGRSTLQAYAYLLLPKALLSVGESRKRVNAIKQYSSLGAGFKIALRDLEIRGAGNVLGTQQSGHIVAIGFDLYCSLLKQAMAQHTGQAQSNPDQATLHLDFVASREADFAAIPAEHKAPAFLPVSYIAAPETRIEAYRSLAATRDLAGLEALEASWKDRFGGRVPEAVSNLLLTGAIRIIAGARSIQVVEVKEHKVMLRKNGDYVLIGNKFPRLPASEKPSTRLRMLRKLIEQL